VLQRNGAVKLTRSMNAAKVPATVQGVLASRIDRLSAEEKELLQTLAVLGREFPLGLVQRVTLKPENELECRLSRLQAAEFIYEQPAAGDVEYIFKHALTQEVAYNALLVERRKLLHERAGLALESMFAEQLDDHLGELAHHYSRSDNAGKAVEYLGRAGQQALQRSAYADAIGNLSAGLNLLQRLPDSPERIRQELLLQLALGPALVAVKGRAAQEVACATFERGSFVSGWATPRRFSPPAWAVGRSFIARRVTDIGTVTPVPVLTGLHRAHVCDRFFAVLPVLGAGGRGTGSRRPSPSATVASVTASACSSKSTRGCPRRALASCNSAIRAYI
jgi:hypothetical protein